MDGCGCGAGGDGIVGSGDGGGGIAGCECRFETVLNNDSIAGDRCLCCGGGRLGGTYSSGGGLGVGGGGGLTRMSAIGCWSSKVTCLDVGGTYSGGGLGVGNGGGALTLTHKLFCICCAFGIVTFGGVNGGVL